MSQEDRTKSLAGSQREDSFVFTDQRSCRCSNSSNENDGTAMSRETERRASCHEASRAVDDTFVADIEQSDEKNRQNELKNRSNEIANEIQSFGPQITDNRVVTSRRFTINDAIEDFSSIRENNDNDKPETDFIVAHIEQKLHHQQMILEQRLRGSNCQISGINATRMQSCDGDDFVNFSRDDKEIAKIEERVTSSPGRTNDERPSTAGSSISFATTCSSNDPDSRINRKIDTSTNETMQHRSQQITAVHHQLPIINNFSANRSNIMRSMRDNKRTNNVDLSNDEIDEMHRINANTNNIGIVNYSPGFRNLHPEHILQPLQRATNPTAKTTFDGIQASNTMEKGKCQCHRIQQHQQPQLLSQIQQREQTHRHHHNHQHHQHHQQQQQQQHRQKLTQQRIQQQQEPQQQYQQNHRHHHYHHPHQHMGQQQEHQRSQNDQMASRKQLSSSGPDEESDDMIETSLGSHQPPALPPRPPPRPNRRYEQNSSAAYDLGPNNGDDAGCCKKYVILCCLCGGLSAAVGSLFLAVHAVLSAHTASLALFETVPSYIPGTMLILMGLFTILLARRKHRYGFLMKMCGSVGVVCALVCVLVTVTTTVVHMSRLQGLRECIYTERARSCTCYGSTQGRVLSDPGVLFEETPHCEAVHGALYDCLRALFGVSVAGILACIFSCMLLYQLLSHEKKKMYWEQLQLRCRSLYGQGGSGAVGGPTGGSCGCCNDCGGASPWWAQTPGNLYTPNPDLAPFSRRWRLPWSRSRGPAPTPDSSYGFHAQSRAAVVMRSSGSSSGEPGENTPGPYSVLTDESQTGGGVVGGVAPYSLINSTNSAPYAACASSVASYSLLENGPVPALWGPPPPYSDPNSPARRSQMSEERRSSAVIRSPTANPTSGTPVNLTGNRISNVKRTMDNFEPGNCEEYRQQQRPTGMRPSDNYENTEEVLSSSTDPEIEMGNLHHHHHHHQQQQHHGHHHSQRQQDEEIAKGRRLRKSLKGVENGGFQQETVNNSLTKQSESELYFGDVSSCCGPESSFYDLAMEKELQQPATLDSADTQIEYPANNRPCKQRQSSRRSRLPLPLPSSAISPETSVAAMTESYSALNDPSIDEDSSRNSSNRGPYLAPDAQYEIIAQQTRYTYYSPKNGERVLETPLSSLASLAYRNGSSSENIDDEAPDERLGTENPHERLGSENFGNNDCKPGTPIAASPTPSILLSSPASSPISRASNVTQRCNNESSGNSRDSLWQAEHQARTIEGVCPVNV